MPGPFSDKFRAKLEEKLKIKKIEVVLNTRIAGLPESADEISKLTAVKTENGETLEADFILKCIGSKLQSDVATSLGDVVDAKTREVKVNEFLQVNGFTHIFAVGDVSNADSQKVSFVGAKQADIAAKNILTLITSEKKGKPAALTKKADFNKPMIVVR